MYPQEMSTQVLASTYLRKGSWLFLLIALLLAKSAVAQEAINLLPPIDEVQPVAFYGNFLSSCRTACG